MINITPRFLSKVIKGAKKKGRDTTKLENAKRNLEDKGNRLWTSRKCNSFNEVERIFDEGRIVRPWGG